MGSLAERNRSHWVETSPEGEARPLDGDLRTDVVVIGAGIAGLTTGLLLALDGARVIVLEAGPLCAGATGYTTAKVTALHGLAYDELLSKHGQERPAAYAAANLAAVGKVQELASTHGIDCDWVSAPALTYVTDAADAPAIEAEVRAARAMGLAADLTEETDLPFPVAAAIRLADQGQFHPRKYCLGLADALRAAGGLVFTGTRVLDVDAEGREVEVQTTSGTVRADRAVVATHLPLNQVGGFFARAHPYRSYAMALEVEGVVPTGMYLGVGGATRSYRPTADPSVIIVGGEGHKVGEDPDTTKRYAAVESWAREHFAVRRVLQQWSAQDYKSVDGLPYVGHSPGSGERVLVATAFAKWGMTNATAAAVILTDLIAGRDNAWLPGFDAGRVAPVASAGAFVKENTGVARHFVGDRLRNFRPPPVTELAEGCGAIVDQDGEKVAAFRDEEGRVHAVSAVCTHLGCQVAFNTAERSWDCPCHGSRFGLDGRVLEGPAVEDLERFA